MNTLISHQSQRRRRRRAYQGVHPAHPRATASSRRPGFEERRRKRGRTPHKSLEADDALTPAHLEGDERGGFPISYLSRARTFPHMTQAYAHVHTHTHTHAHTHAHACKHTHTHTSRQRATCTGTLRECFLLLSFYFRQAARLLALLSRSLSLSLSLALALSRALSLTRARSLSLSLSLSFSLPPISPPFMCDSMAHAAHGADRHK